MRYTHFGEGDYGATEKAIRALLREAGSGSLGGYTRSAGELPSPAPRLRRRLGYERARGFVPGAAGRGLHRYPRTRPLDQSRFAVEGEWRGGRESATAGRDAALSSRFVARKVFLVLSSRGGGAGTARVLLDGRPIRASESGSDVHGAKLRVSGQRLYRLVVAAEGGATGRFAWSFRRESPLTRSRSDSAPGALAAPG